MARRVKVFINISIEERYDIGANGESDFYARDQGVEEGLEF